MKFHFSMINHNSTGKKTLYDMYYWFSAGLRSLGHPVSFSPDRLKKDAINVLWEHFTPEMAEAINESNFRFGIIATEIPGPFGFNNRTESAWQLRWEGFHKIAHKAEFIWTTVPQAIQFYKQFAPTSFIEFGWDQSLVPVWVDQKNEDFKFDFCFLGIINDYRMSILKNLEKHAKVYYSEKLLDWEQTTEIIQHSKIGLGLKQNESWSIPSPTRIGRFLMAKRGFAHDWTPLRTEQARFVSFNQENRDFCDYALEILNKDWKAEAEAAFNRYRDEFPMKSVMKEALNRTMVEKNPPFWKITSKTFFLFQNGSKRKIDDLEERLTYFANPPQLLESYLNYNIVRFKERNIAIPQSLGPIDFTKSFEKLSGVILDGSIEDLKEKIEILVSVR